MLSIIFLTPVQQAHTLEAHVTKACNMSKFPAGDPESRCLPLLEILVISIKFQSFVISIRQK